jgi:hypothetical protein
MMINIAQSQEKFAQRSTKKNSLRSWIYGKGLLDVEIAQNPVVNVANPNSILKYISYDD